MPIASLRFSGIYTEEHRELLIEHSRNRGAVELALEADFAGHQIFNLCAPDTIMDMPTAELAAQYLPQVQSVREASGRWSGYDSAKAEKVLGFRANLLLHA